MPRVANIPRYALHVHNASRRNQALSDPHLCPKPHFDLRDKIFNVAELNRNMVMTARSVGASAKFAGSGGAIVGTYEDEAQFERLKADLKAIGSETFIPTVATSADETAEIVGFGNWRNS